MKKLFASSILLMIEGRKQDICFSDYREANSQKEARNSILVEAKEVERIHVISIETRVACKKGREKYYSWNSRWREDMNFPGEIRRFLERRHHQVKGRK